MSAPSEIIDLIERFSRNAPSYRSSSYGETEVRNEFINPFFKCLGWDIYNTFGAAEAYKDVIHEDAIKIGGENKAPDYCFRIGGARKFFLEAKRPGIDLKNDSAPAFQLRRYGWSAKLPLSILTDFEEFVVYDCRVKPAQTDKPSTARIRYLTFKDYAEHWDSIAGTFSKEAVLKGSFDQYAESNKIKRGTATVDVAFLGEIESWRELLAKNIALRNPTLTQRELNYAVQVTIDRILFLRMCEDRGIEDYGQLRALRNGAGVYDQLKVLFHKADDRYNSGLFHFTKEAGRLEGPDTLTTGLTIDDKPLKDIFKNIYYPDSPYEFSVLPAEILGQVYEQFLGKVIRLTDGHRAVVEEKPEVRKAGGVYYTPTYIVDYIVKNTVGKLLEGKTPKQASKLTVLDPACGSGSFLLGAYQFLLDWHRDRYFEAGPEKHPKELFQGRGGVWHLTSAEKKRILLNNVYGVDIDPQAVEVTKLSLLLKVLEGESQQTLENQRLLYHARALPDLASNIKCGNSLIGPDFYDGQQMLNFDEEERYRINVFDWNAEFSGIMKSGGFDAVIGNPPYVRQESISPIKPYFRDHYEAFDASADLYVYFMEKGIRLLRDGGLFSVIVSSSFLRTTFGAELRATLVKASAVLQIVDFGGLAVFANAKDTYVCIPLLAKGASAMPVEISKVNSQGVKNLAEHVETHSYAVPYERLTANSWSLKSDKESSVFEKIMAAGKPLGIYVDRKFFSGLKTGMNEAFELSNLQRTNLAQTSHNSLDLIKPFLGGQDIRRYALADSDRHLIVIPNGWTRQEMSKSEKTLNKPSERDAWAWFTKNYAAIGEHLLQYAEKLRMRQDQGEYWWELRACDYYGFFERPKIVFPDICKGPRFYLDLKGNYLSNTAYCLGTDELYLLGFLNSRLFWFAIANISIPFGVRAGQYRYRLIYQYMEKTPVRVIDVSKSGDLARQDQIETLVRTMLSLHVLASKSKTPHDRKVLHGQITSIDRQIDKLIYELYNLTPDEIKVVEQVGDESVDSVDAVQEADDEVNGDSTTYVPYQPALDAGISEEWDRKNARRIELALRKSREPLSPEDEAELIELEEAFGAYTESLFPKSLVVDERLEKMEAKYKDAE